MTSQNIKLNFVNRSADTNNSSIVVFQKNMAEDFDETIIAWKVIKNCQPGDNHPFEYSFQTEVSAMDSYGNYTPKLEAYNGQRVEVRDDKSGSVLKAESQSSTTPNGLQFVNNLTQGAVSANIYRNGKLLARKGKLAPGQSAESQFQTRLYIGLASQVEEGDVLSSAIIAQIPAEVNLLGIESADIVLTGGGSGETAEAFSLDLENIVFQKPQLLRSKLATEANAERFENTWYSGDFRSTPSNTPPYNGFKINVRTVINSDGAMQPPVVTITDFAHVKEGFSVELAPINRLNDWVNLPEIERDLVTEVQKFSVIGSICLSYEFSGIYLRVRLCSGIDPRRENLGFLMRFDGARSIVKNA